MSISRNVVILGSDGSGKRTLGKYIVGRDIFQHETALGTGAHYREVKAGDIFYRILTVDTGSLQTVCNNPVPHIQHKFQQIHLIIFAISHGRYTDESQGSLVHVVECLHQQAKSISALVITHCEGMTDEQREAIITDDARGSQVVAFMQRGTYALGFSDLSTLPPDGKPILQNAIDRDEEVIRKLVKQSEIPLSTKTLSLSQDPVSRNVVILGKVGSGKRTLGNHIVGRDIFQLATALGTRHVGSHYGEVPIGDTFYRILTIDTESLQSGYYNPISDMKLKFQEIHSIIFAIPHDHNTDENYESLMHGVESFHQQAKSVSALVITHCEGMTDKQREAIIVEIRDDARSSQVVAFMQHGIFAVGFPDLSTLPSDGKPILEDVIKTHEEAAGFPDLSTLHPDGKPILQDVIKRDEEAAGFPHLSTLPPNGKPILQDVIERDEEAVGFPDFSTWPSDGKPIIPDVIERDEEAAGFPDLSTLPPNGKLIIPDVIERDEEAVGFPDFSTLPPNEKPIIQDVIERDEEAAGFPHLSTLPPNGKLIIQDIIERDEEAVGFPDFSTLPPNGKPILQNAINRDEEVIRKLVERCEIPLSTKSLAVSLRNVVILGKVGSGKRTLGNHIVGRDIFQRETALGTRNVGVHYGEVPIGDTFYRILTVDTESLQTDYNNPIPDIQQKFQEIHSLIFAIPHGRYTDKSHWSLMHAVESLHHQSKSVSALVITHCEGMTDEQREAIIAEFRDDARSSQVVAFMKHGTIAVGFPDLSTLPPTVKSILQNTIDRDEEAIRKLVERCENPLSTKSLPGFKLGFQQPFRRPSPTEGIEKQARESGDVGLRQFISNNCNIL